MKHTFLFMFIVILLFACSPHAVTPAEEQGVASTSPSTEPTATVATPTEVVDPVAGVKPEGALAVDQETGRWYREVDGKRQYFLKEHGEHGVWAERLSPQSIYMMNINVFARPDLFDNNNIPPQSAPLNIYWPVDYGKSPISSILQNPTYESAFEKYENRESSFTTQYICSFVQVLNKTQDPSWLKRSQATLPLIEQFFKDYSTLKMALDIPKVAKDNTVVETKYWYPIKGLDVILVPPEQAKDPSFFGSNSPSIQEKWDVNDNGKLIITGAISPAPGKEYETMRDLIFKSLALAIQTQQLPEIDLVGVDLPRMSNEFHHKAVPIPEEKWDKWYTYHDNMDYMIMFGVEVADSDIARGVGAPLIQITLPTP